VNGRRLLSAFFKHIINENMGKKDITNLACPHKGYHEDNKVAAKLVKEATGTVSLWVVLKMGAPHKQFRG
jgi:hypothetical protein